MRAINFDCVKYIGRLHDCLLQNGSEIPKLERMQMLYGGGKTQSGKTALKVVAIHTLYKMAHWLPHCATFTVICTPINKSCAALKKKINDMIDMFDESVRPPLIGITPAIDGARQDEHGNPIRPRDFSTELERTMLACGGVVCTFTGSQMDKLRKEIGSLRGNEHAGRFILIADEADDVIRNRDERRKIQIERSLAKLMGAGKGRGRFKGPQFMLHISATLVPVFLHLQRQRLTCHTTSEDIFYVTTGEDYNGITDLKPMVDHAGHNIFLDHGELTKHNCHYSPKVWQLFDDLVNNSGTPIAIASSSQSPQANVRKKGLLLDITTSSVKAEASIFDKATYAQNQYRTLAVIVIHGGGIEYRLPLDHARGSQPRFTPFAPGTTASDAIEQLETWVNPVTPMAIFGYSRMIRSESFRSGTRVPTHIVLNLGKTMSIDKFIQAMGRATFRGASLLKFERNNWEHVKILTTHNDYDSAIRYQNWQAEVKHKMEAGKKLSECLTPGQAFRYDSNFLLRSNRTVGQKNACLADVIDSFVKWDDAPVNAPLPAGAEYAARVWMNMDIDEHDYTSLVRKTLMDAAGTDQKAMTSAEIVEEIRNEVDNHEHKAALNTTHTSKILNNLVESGVLNKQYRDTGTRKQPLEYWFSDQIIADRIAWASHGASAPAASESSHLPSQPRLSDAQAQEVEAHAMGLAPPGSPGLTVAGTMEPAPPGSPGSPIELD